MAELKETKNDEDVNSDNILIILRGFPGGGKSTLTKAITNYFGESKCISCSFDKYHWSEQEEGKGVFKFNYSIHSDTKKWCHQEILTSFIQKKQIIIVDNANFSKYEYSDFVQQAKYHKYEIFIFEIKSETASITRYDHIKHIDDNKENDECLLCMMQYKRCKMLIPNKTMKTFINKYENDSNAILIHPKLNENEKWTKEELKCLLSKKKRINYDEYKNDEWKHKKRDKYKKNNYNQYNTQNYHYNNHRGTNHHDNDHYNNYHTNHGDNNYRRNNHQHHNDKKRYRSNNNSRHNMKDPLDCTLDELLNEPRRKRARYNNYNKSRGYQ